MSYQMHTIGPDLLIPLLLADRAIRAIGLSDDTETYTASILLRHPEPVIASISRLNLRPRPYHTTGFLRRYVLAQCVRAAIPDLVRGRFEVDLD